MGSFSKRRKARKEKKSGSYVKFGLAKLADEARRRALSTTCACEDRQRCPHANTIWTTRADKLEAVRGDMAVGVWNLRDDERFWQVVDGLKAKVVGKKIEQPRSGPAKSMKGGLHELRQNARKKAIGTMCQCPPWEECQHDPERDGGVWSERYLKLKSLTMDAALGLLPHLGSPDVWKIVDALGTANGDTPPPSGHCGVDQARMMEPA